MQHSRLLLEMLSAVSMPSGLSSSAVSDDGTFGGKGTICLKIGEWACFRCPGYLVWHSAARPEGCWSPMSHYGCLWSTRAPERAQHSIETTVPVWQQHPPTYRRTTVSPFCKNIYYVLIPWAKLFYNYFKVNCLNKLASQLATHFLSTFAHESELQITKKREPILRDELWDHGNGICRASEFVRAFIL